MSRNIFPNATQFQTSEAALERRVLFEETVSEDKGEVVKKSETCTDVIFV